MLTANDVLVVVPALNEEKSLQNVLLELHHAGFQTLVVDDGSRDGTADIARRSNAALLQLRTNLGVGGALRAGFRFAVQEGFRAAVQIDADGQHPVAEIDTLIEESNTANAHMVIGSRFLGAERTMNVNFLRRAVMRLLSISASRAAGRRISDTTSGFRLIRQPLLSEFAESFPTNYLGDTYEAVVTAGRAGYRIYEVPARLVDREHGSSSASTSQAVTLTIKALAVSLLRVHFRINPAESNR
jgi:glycosyltransferase involved in cell wall biosynthesis